MTRDPARAAKMLPEEVRCVRADIADAESVARAAEGCGQIYVNLTNPVSRGKPDPDVIGTASAIQAARLIGAQRLLRISALGTSADDAWWVIRRKAAADAAVVSSGVAYTIFRPAWFMESLPMFIVGGGFVLSMGAAMRTHWIAGDDFGRQVVAAAQREASANRVYSVQGPTAMDLPGAVREFAGRWSPRLRIMPMPAIARKALRAVVAPLAYLDDLLEYYTRVERGQVSRETWEELGTPRMTIEEYVEYSNRTGDVPRK
jgi:uncharacterized protein YbjT (DUF2867 family)